MSRAATAAVCTLALLGLTGCGDKPSQPSQPTEFKSRPGGDPHGHDHDHDHDRGRAMLEDVELPDGTKCHAALAAHLSEAGDHALEVSFETFDKDPRPVTLPETTPITLRVERGSETFVLSLAPGPKEERKTDPEGRSSRFEAEAKWLRPDDRLTVTLSFAGSDKKFVWVDFDVAKYGHRHD